MASGQAAGRAGSVELQSSGAAETSEFAERLRLRAYLLALAALFVVLQQAFVPMDEFVHRADDAFYYFGVAANFPELGFWSFDSIHSTNGVQPLWAVLLSAVALPLAWLGVDDPHAYARTFAGLAAVCHFAAAVVLFHILARRVSVGTAIVGAGAFLLPIGIVWAHARGMENSLYALLLLSTIAYFHFRFLPAPGYRRGVILGVLLGLTALSRLNAGLFVVCLLAYYLLRRSHGPAEQRLRLAAVAAGAAGVLLAPYFAANLAATGHLLPISGAAKEVELERVLEEENIDSRLSLEYVSWASDRAIGPLKRFVSARSLDALWPLGSRAAFDGDVPVKRLVAFLALLALLPVALARPREWLRFLLGRFAGLGPFAYVLAFSILNVLVSTALYPNEIFYAGVRWWFAETEIAIVTLVATLLAAVLAYVSRRVFSAGLTLRLATAGLVLLVAFHVQDHVRFFWDGKVVHKEWNRSWNDESYLAAQWLARNVPADAIVGSWNAGVLGFYADQRVVNLDGLINNFELLDYIKRGEVAEYIAREDIEYLSDMESTIERRGVVGKLELREVYSHYSDFQRETYRIYKVDGSS